LNFFYSTKLKTKNAGALLILLKTPPQPPPMSGMVFLGSNFIIFTPGIRDIEFLLVFFSLKIQ
jgi:hypothetical protein